MGNRRSGLKFLIALSFVALLASIALAQAILWEQDCLGDVFTSPIPGGQRVSCVAFVSPTDTPLPLATETPTEAPAPTSTGSGQATDTPTPIETPAPIDTPTEVPLATDTPTETSTPTETPIPTPTDTATATETPTETATPIPTDTPTPTDTATPTETATPTNTPTATPTPFNLILNRNFTAHTSVPGPGHSHLFPPWQQVNNRWMWSPKLNPCEDSEAKMGQDNPYPGTTYGWLVGDEDWLWQVVGMPEPHTEIVFSLFEIQHMQPGAGGVAEIWIYGSNDNGQTWDVVFYRPEPAAPMNTIENRSVWYPFTYVIQSSHVLYKIEFHGILMHANDGFKFSCVGLERQ